MSLWHLIAVAFDKVEVIRLINTLDVIIIGHILNYVLGILQRNMSSFVIIGHLRSLSIEIMVAEIDILVDHAVELGLQFACRLNYPCSSISRVLKFDRWRRIYV